MGFYDSFIIGAGLFTGAFFACSAIYLIMSIVISVSRALSGRQAAGDKLCELSTREITRPKWHAMSKGQLTSASDFAEVLHWIRRLTCVQKEPP